jgi:O-antigen/teichoic acid export membrane protein
MTRLWTAHRLRRLGGVASAQVLVQAVGFAAGILLVRHMEQSQYGYYTLAISMVGVGSVLMDLGLGTAVLAIGGALGGERTRVAALWGDALALQRRLAVWAGLLLWFGFALLFGRQPLAWPEVAALSILAVVCTGLHARSQVALAILRLRGEVMLQQRLEVGVNLGKLVLVALAVVIYLDARVAVATNLLAAAALLALLLHALTRHVGIPTATHEHDGRLFQFVRQQAPNSLYYCVSGHVSIWLVGVLGSADRVAEAGALGRLALVFTLIGAVFTALVQPYFARVRSRRELVAGFVAINLFFVGVTTLLVVAALFAPQPLLWILGPRYAGLTHELVWMALAASLAAWSGAAYSVSAARGWVLPSALVIPMGLSTLALCAILIDMSTVAGTFMMNTAAAAVATLLTIGFGAIQLARAQLNGRIGAHP